MAVAVGEGVRDATESSVAVGGTVRVGAMGVDVALEATCDGDGEGEEEEDDGVDDGVEDGEVADGVAVAVHVAVDSLPGVSVAVGGTETGVPTGSHVKVMRPRGNCFSVQRNWSLTCWASALFMSCPTNSPDKKPMSTTTAVVATRRQRRREVGDRRSGEMGYS